MLQLSVLLEKGVLRTILLLPIQKYQRHLWNHPQETSGECLLASGVRKPPEDLLLTGPHTSEDIEDKPRESLEKDTVNEDIHEEPKRFLRRILSMNLLIL